MGTAKRERQKANRQQRLIEEARAERTGKMKRNLLRGALAVVAAIAAVVLIAWVGGAFDGDEVAAPTDTAPIDTTPFDTTPVDTTPVETFPVPPKPEVAIPDEIPETLEVTVLEAGEGPEAAVGDTVVVHYVGVLSADGTEFDASYDRGQPIPVTLGSNSVIQGWEEGLIGAQEGARIQLDIPSDLAYGEQGSGAVIEPGAALTFVVDVMAIESGV